MIKRVGFLFLTITFFSLCCCGPAAELVPVYVEKTPVKIVGEYSLGRSRFSDLKLYGKPYPCRDDPDATCYPTIVDKAIVNIGWNDDFILIEQHLTGESIFATPDSSKPLWFIIDIHSGLIHESHSYTEYVELVEFLGISGIEMQDALEVYDQ